MACCTFLSCWYSLQCDRTRFLVSNQNRTLLFNTDGSPTARAHKILTNTPMGRFGEAEELVGGILFLIDERYSSFVNGVVLPIDGGFSAYSGV